MRSRTQYIKVMTLRVVDEAIMKDDLLHYAGRLDSVELGRENKRKTIKYGKWGVSKAKCAEQNPFHFDLHLNRHYNYLCSCNAVDFGGLEWMT